ncbi:MAG: fructosamine kinase family protein [Christensenellales bacterium]
MTGMNLEIDKIILSIFDCQPLSVSEAGSGFYGKVFKVTLPVAPYIVSVKLFDKTEYLFMQEREQSLIHSLGMVRIPAVLHTYVNNNVNALIMEWAEGENLGDMPLPSASERNTIGWEVVNQAIALHRAANHTYGYVNGKQYNTWQSFYYDLSIEMLARIKKGAEQGLMQKQSLALMEYALSQFDYIFSDEIKAPSLIHGDLNIGNVIVKGSAVSAIIDPMGVMWGDREIELFQFECSGSDKYDLLEKYFSVNKPSTKFEIKNAYYKTFAEANHYARINMAQDDNLSDFLSQLERMIVRYRL